MKRKLVTIITAFLIFFQVPADSRWTGNSSSDKHSVDLDNSRVSWIGRKPAGEHHGYVKLLAGEIQVDNNEIRSGYFIINMNSITDTDLADKSSNAKLIGHLKSPDFFDVQKYPSGSFAITRVTRIPVASAGTGEIKSTHKIEGDLTLKNITKKISFDASVNTLNGKLTATSLPFTIDRTHWDVNYQSKSVTAALKDQYIFDEITLTIDLVTK